MSVARIAEGMWTCSKRWELEALLVEQGHVWPGVNRERQPMCAGECMARILAWMDGRGDPEGRLGTLKPEDIAKVETAACWTGKPGLLFAALRRTGWIVLGADGIARWHDYGAFNRRAQLRRARAESAGRASAEARRSRGEWGKRTEDGRFRKSPGPKAKRETTPTLNLLSTDFPQHQGDTCAAGDSDAVSKVECVRTCETAPTIQPQQPQALVEGCRYDAEHLRDTHAPPHDAGRLEMAELPFTDIRTKPNSPGRVRRRRGEEQQTQKVLRSSPPLVVCVTCKEEGPPPGYGIHQLAKVAPVGMEGWPEWTHDPLVTVPTCHPHRARLQAGARLFAPASLAQLPDAPPKARAGT